MTETEGAFQRAKAFRFDVVGEETRHVRCGTGDLHPPGDADDDVREVSLVLGLGPPSIKARTSHTFDECRSSAEIAALYDAGWVGRSPHPHGSRHP